MEPENQKPLRTKVMSNMIWRFLERFGAQGVSFLVSVILARLLEPDAYGIVALAVVFTSLLQVFVDSGLGTALIQKKDTDDLDYSTVFYFNVTVCLLLYGLLFLCAPAIARFYHNTDLTNVIRCLGLTVIISGVKNVQQAYVSKNLIFKKFFFATLAGTVLAALAGIGMAVCGFGVWALVTQHLLNAAMDTLILWITVDWRPVRKFSWKRFHRLFSYGWKILTASLIHRLYTEFRQLAIGRIYTASDLAFYNRGRNFPDFIVANINTSIDSVLLPVMSGSQDNIEALQKITRKSIRVSGYLMWPMMFGLIAVGKRFLALVLTEKWLPAYPYLCVFCIVKGLEPVQTANLNAIRAMGRSDLILKMEVTKKTVGFLIVLLTMRISVFALAVSSLFYTVYASMINAFPNRKLLHYSYFAQLRDMSSSFLMSAVMCGIIYPMALLPVPAWFVLILQVITGAAVYAGLSVLFKVEEFFYLLDTLKSFWSVKRK